MSKNINIGLLILRLAVGALMLLHGIAKLKGVDFIEGLLEKNSLPAFMAYGVYITEIIVPIFIIIGYRTRLASAVFALGILFTIFLAHPENIFSLSQSGGWAIELLGLFFLGAIALFFTGSGKFAVSYKSRWD